MPTTNLSPAAARKLRQLSAPGAYHTQKLSTARTSRVLIELQLAGMITVTPHHNGEIKIVAA
jgi:hypothetical protein